MESFTSTKNSTSGRNIAGAQKWHICEQVALAGVAEKHSALRWVFHHVQERTALDPLSASSRIRLAVVRVLIAMPLSGAVPGYVETDFILALCLSSHAPRLLGQNLSNTVLLCLPDAQNHSWQQRSFRAPAARQAQLR